MSNEEIKKIQDHVNALPLNKILHDAGFAEEFARLFKQIFPNDNLCTTCPGELERAYYRILILSPSIPKQMDNHNYRMGEGQIIDTVYHPIEGVPLHVTNANLTDEVAEKLLKSNPNYKSQIIKVGATETPAGGVSHSITVDAKDISTGEETVESLVDNNTKQQLIDKLKEAKIEFDAASNKTELATLLIEKK